MTRGDHVRRLFKSGAVLFVAMGMELLISFVGKALIARYLGGADYGSVAIGIAVVTTVPAVGVLGMDRGIARYLPRFDDADQRSRVVLTGLVVGLPIPILCGGAVFVYAEWIATVVLRSPSVAPVLRVFGPVIPFSAFGALALGITQGQKETLPKVVVVHLTMPLSRILGIAVAVVIGASLVEFSLAYALPAVVAFPLWLYFVRDVGARLRRSIPRPDPELASALVRFSLPLALTSILAKVLSDADVFLLSYLLDGTNAVGVYYVIYPMANLLNVGLVALGFVFMPELSAYHSEGDWEQIRRTYAVVTKWVTLLVLPVTLVFLLFPTASIRWTFGAEYLPGAFALQVLVVGFFVNSVVGLNRETLSALGKTRLIVVAQAATVALNLALNLVLIPQYSYVGAAAATTAALVFMNAALSGYLYHTDGIVPFQRAAAVPTLGVTVISLGIAVLTAPLRPLSLVEFLVVIAAVLAAVPFALVAFGGIQSEEILIVESIEERFGLDLEPLKRIARRLM